MGLLSALFGGKKRAADAAVKPTSMEKQLEAIVPQPEASAAPPDQAAMQAAGVTQAKLRLKLAAALRARDDAAAYEAATGLADIQARAGRNTAARQWREQAQRIKNGLAA